MDGTKGGLLAAAIPAGWSRMSWVAISPISIEKHQSVTLCPKTQAPAGEGSWRCSGTGAWQQGYWDSAAGVLGLGSRGTGTLQQGYWDSAAGVLWPPAAPPCPAREKGKAEHLSSRGEQHQLPAADLPCPAQQLHF